MGSEGKRRMPRGAQIRTHDTALFIFQRETQMVRVRTVTAESKRARRLLFQAICLWTGATSLRSIVLK
jgi:hypothetical protein